MLVFREDKSLEDERKAWEFWHGRQHSFKQRILDIGTATTVPFSASSLCNVYSLVIVQSKHYENNTFVLRQL